MSTEKYRYYRFDRGARQIHNAEWVYCASDEEAVAHVGAKHSDASCEVWQGKRLVAKWLPGQRPAAAVA